jgi:CHAT domain-containing protein
LNDLAGAHSKLGEKQKALDYLAQSLPLYSADPTLLARQREANTLTGIGWIYLQLGEMNKAGDNFEKALPLHRLTGDSRGESTALKGLAWIYSTRAGKEQESLDDFTRSLDISRAIGDRRAEADILYLGALFQRNRTNLQEARRLIEDALAIVESLRAKITNQDLRSSYFATVQGFYQLYIDILMRLHGVKPTGDYDGMALAASERGRARALLETLAEANSDIRQGVDPMLLERERALQKRLNAKAEEQTKMFGLPHRDEQAKGIAKDIESLTTEFQQVEAQIRQTSPQYAALTQPQPLSLRAIQTQVLDADTILLEYSLGAERSYLWAVTPTSITSYELPKRDEIETLARQVYTLLSDKSSAVDTLAGLRSGNKQSPSLKQTNTSTPRNTPSKSEPPTVSSPEAADRLSQILLGPVAAQLGNKRLLIVADGALQYIPFGALPSPTGQTAREKYQPLIVDHEIVSLPSASTLAVLRQEVKDRKPAPKTVAVLADPVFENDDERLGALSRRNAAGSIGGPEKRRELPRGMERAATDSGLRSAVSGIPRLPGTRDEARQILALVPAAEGKQALDFSASRQTAMSVELSQYRYVHFATHGFLDSLHPELSGIVFSMVDEKGNSQDGFLRAHEVFNLKLPAELIVLSACQTGLGKEVSGEGLVGLTRGFMYAGAPRVVVSLWSVNDTATAALMARFYRGMLRDKLPPAAALRAAQVSLMKEKVWQSPFYWAAFTLQGEWR